MNQPDRKRIFQAPRALFGRLFKGGGVFLLACLLVGAAGTWAGPASLPAGKANAEKTKPKDAEQEKDTLSLAACYALAVERLDRDALQEEILRAIAARQKVPPSSLQLDCFFFWYVPIRAGVPPTVILLGTWGKRPEEGRRPPIGMEETPDYVAIFDANAGDIHHPPPPDRLRYELSSLLFVKKKQGYQFLFIWEHEPLDIDRDGIDELFLHISFVYMGPTAPIPLIFKRRFPKGWDLVTLPDLAELLWEVFPEEKGGTKRIPASLHPVGTFPVSPREIAIMRKDAAVGGIEKETSFYKEVAKKYWKPLEIPSPHRISRAELLRRFKKVDISLPLELEQTNIPADMDGRAIRLHGLMAGHFELRKHPVTGNTQIVLYTDTGGNRGFVGNYRMFMVLALDGRRWIPDPLWNWGYPMFSKYPIPYYAYLLDSRVDQIWWSGLRAHVKGDRFYGYTRSWKLKPGWDKKEKEKGNASSAPGGSASPEDSPDVESPLALR